MPTKPKVTKTKLESLSQTHGKVDEIKPTTLEQIWGFNDMARYKTTDASIYESELNDMTRTDLEAKSRSYGLVVVQDTNRLRSNLLKEFNVYMASLRVPVNKIKGQTNPSDEVKKILAEGR